MTAPLGRKDKEHYASSLSGTATENGPDISPVDATQTGRPFTIDRLARIEAAPVMVPAALLSEIDASSLHLIGYHHCPSLCVVERAPLYVFGLDASPFHRCLAANLMGEAELWARLDRDGLLGWSSGANPPCPLHIGFWDMKAADKTGEEVMVAPAPHDVPDPKADRRGWMVPVYGPYARKGFFLLEDRRKGKPHPLSATLRAGLAELHNALSRKIAISDRRAELTQREIDVTRWIVYGKSNPVIAEILDLSTHTVNGYLRRIYLKTGTADRVSLAIYAVNHGFV